MSARTHTSSNQRAIPADRKVVFKSVLDNPFHIPWPRVPLNVQNAALASLVTILAGVAEYHIARHDVGRKRKRARREEARREKTAARKKQKVSDEGAGLEVENAQEAVKKDRGLTEDSTSGTQPAQMDTDTVAVTDTQVPPVFSHLTFGINEVTKRLESQSHSRRLRVSVGSTSSRSKEESSPKLPSLTYIFVCRADVDPPLLIAHLPDLVAACNAPSLTQPLAPVRLIPLPKHAEQTLADALGLRRVSVLALDSATPSLDTLSAILSSVQPPSAPWLTASAVSHVPTHIKQLRTTAPRDMRAAKRTRTEGRQAAKEKSKHEQLSASDHTKKPRQKKKIRVIASAPHPDSSKDLLPT